MFYAILSIIIFVAMVVGVAVSLHADKRTDEN